MKKSTLLGLLCIGLLILNLALTAMMFLRKPGPPNHKHRKNGERTLIDKIGLDESQTTLYKSLRTYHMSSNESLNRELYAAYDDLFELLTYEQLDTVQRDKLFIQIEGLTTQLNQSNLNHFLKVRGLLNEDQIPNFNAFTYDLRRTFNPNRKQPLSRKK